MLSRGFKRRLYQLISIILCISIVTQCSPLATGAARRPRLSPAPTVADNRSPRTSKGRVSTQPQRAPHPLSLTDSSAAMATPSPPSHGQPGLAAQALPTPSPASSEAVSSTPQPGAGQGTLIEEALHAVPPSQGPAGLKLQPLQPPATATPSATPSAPPTRSGKDQPVPVDAGPGLPPLPPGLTWSQMLPRPQPPQPPVGLSSSAMEGAAGSMPATWNLVSTALEPDDTDPAAVLSSIAGKYNLVYAYDGCDDADPWKLYDPAAPAASDLTAIDRRIGFWIQMTVEATLAVHGTWHTSTDIPLCQGWNLIGYPLEKSQPVPEALASIAGKYTLVYAWDATDAADPWEIYSVDRPAWANELKVMDPGRGYWVYATEDVTLTIAEVVPTPTPTETPEPVGQPPTAEITSPDEGTEVTDFVDIVGTADDPDGDLVRYELQYRPTGSPTRTTRGRQVQDADGWITFFTGNAPVVNDVLGQFDPTLLRNGMYDIRLVSIDGGGWRTTAMTQVVLTGDQKIGHFTLTFTDMVLPVSGIDVTVLRTYDSRDKRVGDFGVGWSLTLKDVELQESNVPGEGWEQQVVQPGMFPTYCLQPTQLHMVTVTFPDGEVYRFAPTLSPQCQPLVPIRYATVGFDPLPGTNARLEPLGGNDVVVVGDAGGAVELWDLDLNLYDPSTYRLTTRDGTTYLIDQTDGVQRITEPNGNSLTFTANDITHSSGKSVAFQRDGLGRITRITDPRGNTIQYAYDAVGDLVSVTDRGGNVTTFTYAAGHYLQDINAPLGRTPMRSEYDADGRLIRHTDASGKTIEYSYDLAGHKETITDRQGNVTAIEYDANGYITKLTDAEGNSISYTNDSRGNRTSETDQLSNTTTYTYDSNDQLTSETDPLGNTTSYTYDGTGRVTSSTDPEGNTVTFEYDARGNLTRIADPVGNATEYSYDSQGNIKSITDPLGCTFSYEYDAWGNVTRQVDPIGNVTTFTYDGNGNELTRTLTRSTASGTEPLVFRSEYDELDRLVRITHPDGSVVSFEYDALGNQVASIDKLGRRTEYEYDARGQIVKVTFPDGTFEAYTYDEEGRQLNYTDVAGRVTAYEYDALGRQTKITLPDGSFTTLAYDAGDRVIARTDERGNTTFFAYDEAGRRTGVTDALGNTTAYAYDAAGRLIAITDANDNTTRYTYDANSQLSQITYPDGTNRRFTYDAKGRPIAETDQAGNVTHFEYDCLDRQTKVIDPLGGETTFTYDEVGNLISQTDANGNTTTFEYDMLGQLIKRTQPLGQSETMTYDTVGNLVSLTDFNGNTITYGYDVNNRLIKKTYPDGSTVTYTYTSTGQRASVTDSRGTTTYAYDASDRLLRVTHPDGRAVSYTYDAAGNRTSLTFPAGTVNYTFDALNRLATVTDPDGGITRYTYDAVGNRTSVTYPNGTDTSYTYDALNRLTLLENRRADGSLISSYAYTLDPTGRRTRVVEHTGRVVDYTYDARYLLTQEHINDPVTGISTISYTYDAVGNRLTKTDASGTINYTYDANDRLLSDGTNTYTYDANGNTLSRTGPGGVVTYQYDYEDRLIRATTVAGGTTVVDYVYDADGIRVQSIVDGADVTNYLVDHNFPFSQVLLETDSAGATLASYVYGDDLISMKRSSDTFYYHYDGHMSVRQLTDNTGAVTDKYIYDAFGLLLAQTGGTTNNYRYTGEQFDPQLDSYYLRARYYNPAIGRFLTQDLFPASPTDPITLHRYLYANGDPVNNWDPTGHFGVAELGVSTAIAVSIANVYNGVVASVGFTVIHVIQGVAAGHSANQILTSWLWGEALGAVFLALGPILKLAKAGGGRLGKWIQQALADKIKGPARDGVTELLAVVSKVDASKYRTISGLGRATKEGIVKALKTGTGWDKRIAKAIEAGRIEVKFTGKILKRIKGEDVEVRALRQGNTIWIRKGSDVLQAAVEVVHEGTHVLDRTPGTVSLERELRAFAAQINFARRVGIYDLAGGRKVYEEFGITGLIKNITKKYGF